MNSSIRSVLVFVSLALALAFGCGAAQAAGGSNGTKFTFGLSVSTLENPFFVRVKNGAEKAANEDHAKLMVSDAQNNPQKQLNDVEDMITKGADAILLNPIEPKSGETIVRLANRHHIPVVTIDRRAAGGQVASFIASDNVKGGRMICEWLAKKLNGKGNIAIIQGTPGSSPEIDRNKGCNEALKQYPGIDVVAKQPADWSKEKGYNVAQNIYQAHPNLVAVFGRNDLSSLGAVEAAKQAGLLDRLTIVSFDGIADALKSIQKGQLSATVVQNPELLGSTAVKTAVHALNGDKVPKVQKMPIQVADQSNINEFIGPKD